MFAALSLCNDQSPRVQEGPQKSRRRPAGKEHRSGRFVVARWSSRRKKKLHEARPALLPGRAAMTSFWRLSNAHTSPKCACVPSPAVHLLLSPTRLRCRLPALYLQSRAYIIKVFYSSRSVSQRSPYRIGRTRLLAAGRDSRRTTQTDNVGKKGIQWVPCSCRMN